MSRFPDLAALKKLVAASALGTKRKSMKLRVLLFSPTTNTGSVLYFAAEKVTTETRQRPGRSHWELLGQTEVPRIRQEEEGSWT